MQKRYKLDLDYWFDWQDYVWNMVNYKPYPWQRNFHKRMEKDAILHATNQGGKSLMKAMEALPLLLLPNQHIWVVSATFELGTYEWIYCIEGEPTAGILGINQLKRKYRKYRDIRVNEAKHEIKTPWASFIKAKSIRTGGAEEAEGVDWMMISEASNKNMPVNYYEQYMEPRLIVRNGSFGIATTLRGKGGFVNWCRERAKRDDCYYATGITAYDCPHITKEAIDRAEEIMPTKYFEERFLGMAVAYLGEIIRSYNIYDNVLFQSEVEDIKKAIVFDKCDIFGSVYYGFGAKRSFFLLLAHNYETDQLYVIDEIVEDEPITALALARKIANLFDKWEIDSDKTIYSNQTLCDTLYTCDLSGADFIDDEDALESSLGRTDSYFELNKIEVAKNLEGMKFSLDNYIWDREKDAPLQENFEGVECLRIAIEGFEESNDYFEPGMFESFGKSLQSDTEFGDIR